MDPYVVLGISLEASEEEVRIAWKRHARHAHPDAGGSVAAMQEVNEALRCVLRDIRLRANSPATSRVETPLADRSEKKPTKRQTHWSRASRDVSSFTVDCLPVEAYEALLIAVSWHGDLAIDEPPYSVEAIINDPFRCWVRFDIVPEAGASTVSIAVASPDGVPTVSSEDLRDLFVDSLNELDWSQLST